MVKVKPIIVHFRTRMESVGLLRSEKHVQAIQKAGPLIQGNVYIREESEAWRNAIIPSGVSKLFDYAIPKMQEVFDSMEEAQVAQVLEILCQHSQSMVERYGINGSRQHFNDFFEDLPLLGNKIAQVGFIDKLVEAYRQLSFEGQSENYLRATMGDVLRPIRKDKDGKLVLRMRREFKAEDLYFLGKATDVVSLKSNKCYLSDKDLHYIKACKSLQELSLAYETGITDKGLKELAELPNLRSLDLYHASQITDQGMRYLAGMEKLQKLYLGMTQITDQGLFYLSKLSNLRLLYLENTNVTDRGISFLANLGSIEALALGGTRITDQGLQELAYPDKIRSLRLDRSSVTIDGILRFSGLHELIICGDKLQNEDIRKLGSLKQLRTLWIFSLFGNSINDQGIRYLADLVQLEELCLERSKISNKGISYLRDLTKLRRLNLHGTNLSDRALNIIGGYKQLQELILSETRISSRGLKKLSQLPGLVKLSLRKTKVGDRGARYLARHRLLEYLSLSETKISDTSIEIIKDLTNIRILKIDNTKVTSDGVEKLCSLINLRELLIWDLGIPQNIIRRMWKRILRARALKDLA